MSKEQQQKLFKMFSDIKKRNSFGQSFRNLYEQPNDHGCTSGVGLGLHLSLSLARYFKGDVVLTSQLEKGTCVSIILNLPVC